MRESFRLTKNILFFSAPRGRAKFHGCCTGGGLSSLFGFPGFPDYEDGGERAGPRLSVRQNRHQQHNRHNFMLERRANGVQTARPPIPDVRREVA
jgi:hypothetical protein